jgi:hypothetical protein
MKSEQAVLPNPCLEEEEEEEEDDDDDDDDDDNDDLLLHSVTHSFMYLQDVL